ncbi:MAG: cobalamin biosynthesis protein CobD [Nitrospinae bacterium]|nr:cobalamin biosynthesis protein CobD [Nitrospinota bacterium]
MSLSWQILAAAALDLALVDPRWAPHPARGMGWFLTRLERMTRAAFADPLLAGAMTVFTALVAVIGVVWVAIEAARWAHPLAGDVVSIYFIYASFAARDLRDHAMAVWRPLREGNMARARAAVAMMVGRDTHTLDPGGVARAAAESVEENTVDGVTAPLFYAALFGPAGAMAYKAVNTMDSMFGYRNERYLRFGRVAARLDDAANYIPARLTVAVVALASLALRMDAAGALRVAARDGRKHASPNSGLAEAAFAGALRVRFGGANTYGGVPRQSPFIGVEFAAPEVDSVRLAARLMYVTFAAALAAALAARGLTEGWWRLDGIL